MQADAVHQHFFNRLTPGAGRTTMARYPLKWATYTDDDPSPTKKPVSAPRMNGPHSKGFWNLVRDRLRKQYPELTNDDLICPKGGETEMLRRIERRLHKSPLEMAALLDEVFRGARSDAGAGGDRQKPVKQ